MKENKYDESSFFEQYKRMARSVNGLQGAGEWHILKKMLPNFTNKRVLDLGCGFGWHCKYAVDHGAIKVTGIDLSEKMLEVAQEKNNASLIDYHCIAVEDFEYLPNAYDIVISSLTFHYLESFDDICQKIHTCLSKGGSFVFSVEHPVFTAHGKQDWIYDEKGNPLYWPVDNYYQEGKRKAVFLGEEVIKFHKTLTTYINTLIKTGFEIKEIVEPQPEEHVLKSIPEMKEELRRPMMLIISALKK